MVFDRLFLLGVERHEIGADLVEIVMSELGHEGLLPQPAPAEDERRDRPRQPMAPNLPGCSLAT